MTLNYPELSHILQVLDIVLHKIDFTLDTQLQAWSSQGTHNSDQLDTNSKVPTTSSYSVEQHTELRKALYLPIECYC